MTNLLYLTDFNLLETEAKVEDVLNENGKEVVILDQTVFYPQGGGQPYDQGFIESPTGKFKVEEVRFFEGVVKHIGSFESGNFSVDDNVKCSVDQPRRVLNSRLHSAGHVVDMVVNKLMPDWIPGKGFHFPEGPYVEYAGNLTGVDVEKLKSEIENLSNQYLSEDSKVRVEFMDKLKMKNVCHFVPDFIPEGKPGRVVLFGNFGVPCGGTHVNSLSEVKAMTVRKIKNDGGNVRVAYDVVRDV